MSEPQEEIPSELVVHPWLVRTYVRRLAYQIRQYGEHEAIEASSIEAHWLVYNAIKNAFPDAFTNADNWRKRANQSP